MVAENMEWSDQRGIELPRISSGDKYVAGSVC